MSVTGLGTVRSLARSGIRVFGVDTNLNQPSAHTKYCEKIFCKDINDENKLLETLISISKKQRIKPVLFFSTDSSVLIASENRVLLRDYYHFNLPSESVVSTFMDKALFSDFAQKNGYPTPMTFVAQNLGDIKSIAKEMEYPCLVKPAFRSPTWDNATSAKVIKALSAEELIGVYQQHCQLSPKFIVQEQITGSDSEIYFSLMWFNSLSQPIASFVGRKVMQWPSETGSTCVAQSCNVENLAHETARLFGDVKYRGLGSVEFKRDTKSGEFKIVEPTVGRADLQSAIADHAGISIPLLEYCDCLRLPSPELSIRNKKICWINEENLWWVVRNRGDDYSVGEWIGLMSGRKSYALLDVWDLKPFLVFLYGILWRALSG